MKKNGIKVLAITLLESLMATFVVFIGTYYILKIDAPSEERIVSIESNLVI